jgi:16S rRNA (guanine966-N2)-methyltransferase
MCRKALFDVLDYQYCVAGARVLDLFAGSGALAFEAISRGAETAVLVDSSSEVCRHLRTTAETLGISEIVTIMRCDALEALRFHTDEPFGLIFADPPYAHKVANSIASRITDTKVLAAGGVLALEHSDQEMFLQNPSFTVVRSLEFGVTVIDILRHVGPVT